MPFQDATRRKITPLSSKAKGSESPLRFQLPKTGILAGINLEITGSIAGTLSAPNALGKSSIVREVRALANTGAELFRFSGPQYHWLMRDNHDLFTFDPVPFSDGKSAVVAGAFDISMYLPVAVNARDPVGLFLLQNEQTVVTLTVDFEADANVATGATVTATVVPHLELFTVPADRKDWPAFNLIQQIIGETQSVSGAGDFEYVWPRGVTYMQLLLGFGFGVSGADNWSRVVHRAAQTDRMYEFTPNGLNIEFARFRGRSRPLGTLPLDLIGSSGLGLYASSRDVIYSQMITDLKSVITVTGAGTLHAVRRVLAALQ